MRWYLLSLIFFAGVAAADPLDIVWDPAAGATSYDVQRATAMAGPWATIATVASSACTGTPPQCVYTDATPPATGVVFYRLAPKNAAGTLLLTRQGVWYCGDCPGLPAPPKAVGVGF